MFKKMNAINWNHTSRDLQLVFERNYQCDGTILK